MASLSVILTGRPPTMNKVQAQPWHRTAKFVRVWRERAGYAWREAMRDGFAVVPPVVFVVEQKCRDGRMPDTGACMVGAKAIIDGAVDAGLIPDDSPKYVSAIVFAAPSKTGTDMVKVRVIESKEVKW